MAALTNTSIALMSYNIGIQNNEVLGNKWPNKYKRLQDDIESAFTHEAGIQILLLSEFGSMFTSIDTILDSGVEQPTGRKIYNTKQLFEDLLGDINLPDILVVANAPYVALINSECWKVKRHEVLLDLCSKKDIKVQHLILQQ